MRPKTIGKKMKRSASTMTLGGEGTEASGADLKPQRQLASGDAPKLDKKKSNESTSSKSEKKSEKKNEKTEKNEKKNGKREKSKAKEKLKVSYKVTLIGCAHLPS